MGSRLELQAKLEEALGSKNVYYQPPENVKLSYPAIVYGLSGMSRKHADDKEYIRRLRYEITVIDKRPFNSAIDKILKFPYSYYDRPYKADNLYHDAISLYF